MAVLRLFRMVRNLLIISYRNKINLFTIKLGPMQTTKQQQATGKPVGGPSPVNTDFRAGGEEERWPEDPQAADQNPEFDQEAAIERERAVQEAEDGDIVEDDRPGHTAGNAAGASPEKYEETEDEEEDEAVNFDDLGDEEDDPENRPY